MTALERRAVATLAAVFGLRLLGLFLILPVFALYARGLEGHTPFLVGVALGAYGLTQAVFQVPLGLLSDRFGRKPVITAGLVLFAAGGVVAAGADSIHGVIAGRALQGVGAIAAAVLAFAADLTRDEQRTKAMAMIGATAGLAFGVAMVAAPLLDRLLGVRGIFWLTAVLGILAVPLLWRCVPAPPPRRPPRAKAEGAARTAMLRDPVLLRLNAGIFVLHMLLTAMWVAVPLALLEQGGLAREEHWKFYLAVVGLSAVAMVPMVLAASRNRLVRPMLLLAIALLVVAELMLLTRHGSLLALGIGLLVFFAGFNALEAMLPSLVSRVVPGENRGAAIGVFNTCQFLGVFGGGAAGGALYGLMGMTGVFGFGALAAIGWLALMLRAPAPRLLSTETVPLGDRGAAADLARRLRAVPGVVDVTVLADEGVARLRVDSQRLDRALLERLVHG